MNKINRSRRNSENKDCSLQIEKENIDVFATSNKCKKSGK